MKTLISISAVLVFLSLASCSSKQGKAQKGVESTATTPAQIPLRDFFKNPEKAKFQISPGGKFISYLKPWNNRLNIFVQKLSDDHLPVGDAKQITSVKDRDLAGYFWKGDSTLLYLKDFKGDENFHVFAVNVKNGVERDMTPFEKTRADILDDLEEVSDTDILVQTNHRNPELFDVYRLNTQSGDLKLVTENPGNISGWATDHNGAVRIALESDGLKSKVLTRKSESEPFKTILTYDYKNSVSPEFFTFDNKDIYVASNLGRDRLAIVQIDGDTGKEKKVIFERPDVDTGDLYFSQKRKVITQASYTTWKEEHHFFDDVSESRFQKIQKQVGDFQISITSHNKDESLFVVAAASDKVRVRFYLYDDAKDRLTFLADATPWLNPDLLSTMKPIEYKSRDGLTIHGYLTLPKDSDGKNLPIIVNPHGGPWYRDEWRFNSEVQFLASRGYGVFQMNFRGSTGYGKKFLVKSYKQWGKTMQNDITDGVNWLVKTGVADPKRVGIYGGSYGGYATLAGITFTPNLYAAAVDYVGVSNLFTFLQTIPPYWKVELEKMYAMVGDPKKDAKILREGSPVFHTDKIKTPLFVAQGAQDPRVNINESNQIVDSLRKRGVEVQYLVKDNEGHGFHNEENRFEFYGAMETFFRKYLKAN